MPEPGFCPQCGLVVSLRKDGKVRAHKRFKPWGRYGTGMPAFGRCEGSGKTPRLDVSTTTEPQEEK